MKKIVGRKALIKHIKKQLGNFYTEKQIDDIITNEGCVYFNRFSNNTYKYLNFNKWEITEN